MENELLEKGPSSDSSIIRFDSILSKNSIGFKRSFPHNGDMILDVMYYLAWKYQSRSFSDLILPDKFSRQLKIDEIEINNFLSSEGGSDNNPNIRFMFDPFEFSDVMGYNKRYLKKKSLFPGYLVKYFGVKMERPMVAIASITSIKDLPFVLKTITENASSLKIDLKKENFSDKNITLLKEFLSLSVINYFKQQYPHKIHFDSLLDDAVWRAANEKLSFVFNGNLRNYSYASVHGLELLQRAVKFEDSSNRKKIYYAFFVNKTFLENLSQCFCISSPSIIPTLRAERTRHVSEYILSSRYAAMQNDGRLCLDFHLLADLCCIETEIPPRDDVSEKATNARVKIKALITAKLTKALKTLNNIGVVGKLKWEKNPGQRWAYNPVIEFEQTKLLDNNLGLMAVKRFEDDFKYNLYILYLNENKLENSEISFIGFNKWFLSKDGYSLKYPLFKKMSQDFNPNIKDSVIDNSFSQMFPVYKNY